MSDPIKIRVAASYHVGEAKYSSTIRELHDAALAYADTLEDPILWCFTHESIAWDGEGVCQHVLFAPRSTYDCDIAKATRPRRIE